MLMNNIIDALKGAKNIAILPHVSVDGDGLGSSIALALSLKKINKEVIVYLEEEIPSVYSFLPGKALVKTFDYKKSIAGNPPHDVVVALDTGDVERMGERADIFNGARVTINIDHHHTNSEFAFYNYVLPDASATGEIIYKVIKMMGLELDFDTALCLYVAIATDTGGFRFSNTSGITHQITSDLVNNGVNVAEISQQIFDNISLAKTKLMGAAINSLELFENGKIAFISITDEMLKAAGAKDEDCDGIVNIGRSIVGVEVSFVARQKLNGEVKINLRSKNYVDVAAIASMYSGGGHKKAAGFSINKNIDILKKMLLKDIGELL